MSECDNVFLVHVFYFYVLKFIKNKNKLELK